MDIYEAIEKRHTTRDFIAGKSVPAETLKKILAAGLKAPSHDHEREWHFIVIRDPERIMETLAAVEKKAEWQMEIVRSWKTASAEKRGMYLDAVPKQMRMLMQSGCLVIPLFKSPEGMMQPKGLTDLNPFASIWAVIENILLAATAEGVGVALRIPVYEEEDYVLQKVNTPDGYKFPCYLAFGYAAPDAPVIRQTPCSIDERMHEGKW